MKPSLASHRFQEKFVQKFVQSVPLRVICQTTTSDRHPAGCTRGIRTNQLLLESVSYRFYVPRDAIDTAAARAACPTVPDGKVSA